MGDFNINLTISPLHLKLLSIVSSFNLSQIVTEPTRVSNSTSSLIDLIFVSSSVNYFMYYNSSISKCRSLWSAPHYFY